MGCFVDAITNNRRSAKKIGFSALFGAFATAFSFWMIEPNTANESTSKMQDTETTSKTQDMENTENTSEPNPNDIVLSI